MRAPSACARCWRCRWWRTGNRSALPSSRSATGCVRSRPTRFSARRDARLHALAEEERHLQKDFVLIGFGQWGQKAYQHLLTLKQFFNFRTHVVEQDSPAARERIGSKEEDVRGHGDGFYWDSPGATAHDQLERELESSSYVIP